MNGSEPFVFVAPSVAGAGADFGAVGRGLLVTVCCAPFTAAVVGAGAGDSATGGGAVLVLVVVVVGTVGVTGGGITTLTGVQ